MGSMIYSAVWEVGAREREREGGRFCLALLDSQQDRPMEQLINCWKM